MSSDVVAVRADHLSKTYMVFDRPMDRLKQMLSRGGRQYGRRFEALSDVSFSLPKGAVLGIVGNNGAGKSTLLQLLCKTLEPTSGSLTVNGRIAALLELGAGFNPEFSGRENVFLNAAVLGLSSEEISARFDDIVDFSGVGAFIDQPVKTYSSGMYIRLAFAIATAVDPDILVIDEALSVGDGAFARKSFDRIMALRDAGTTILFCSHAMYHIEAICDQALWLRNGRVAMLDTPARVISDYTTFLDRDGTVALSSTAPIAPTTPTNSARIKSIEVFSNNDSPSRELVLHSGRDTLSVRVGFSSDPNLPCPSLGIGILNANGLTISSAGNVNDGIELSRTPGGEGQGILTFPALPLLKGDYYVSVFLLCEKGIHIYDHAERYAVIRISQTGLAQGVVSLPHAWASS